MLSNIRGFPFPISHFPFPPRLPSRRPRLLCVRLWIWVFGLQSAIGNWQSAIAAEAPSKEAPAHGGLMAVIHKKIAELQAKCDADPKAWEPRYELAKLCVGFELAERAAKLIDEAIALKPDHAPIYVLAGDARLAQKDPAKAIAFWEQALKLQPGDAKVQARIAQARKLIEQNAQLAELNARLEKNPNDLDGLVARARLHAAREEWRDAVADTQAVLQAKPDHPEATDLGAQAFYRVGQYDDAIRLWKRAAKANPQRKDYAVWLEYAEKAKGAADSLERIEAKVRAAPDDGKLRVEAGELCAGLGKWSKAFEHLAKAVKLLPNDAAAHRAYGVLLFRLGRMDDAIAELEKCPKLDPANPEYPRLLAELKRMRDMHRETKHGKE